MRISDWSSDVCSTEAHWDVFWRFYQDTGARKWGRPYLTRSFFSMLGETMDDKVLLMLASRDGKPIAGAFNLIGADTDRKSVVSGKSVSVRVVPGGRRTIKTNTTRKSEVIK